MKGLKKKKGKIEEEYTSKVLGYFSLSSLQEFYIPYGIGFLFVLE